MPEKVSERPPKKTFELPRRAFSRTASRVLTLSLGASGSATYPDCGPWVSLMRALGCSGSDLSAPLDDRRLRQAVVAYLPARGGWMRRREFIAALGSATPRALVARAEPPGDASDR
jgi:hypothetical protein